MIDLEILVAKANQFFAEGAFKESAECWRQIFDGAAAGGNRDVAVIAGLRAILAYFNARKLVEAAQMLHLVGALNDELHPDLCQLVIVVIQSLAKYGRNSEALALFPLIRTADIAGQENLFTILGLCAVAMRELSETREALRVAPAGWQSSAIGQLIEAIIWADRPAQIAGYAPYLDANRAEYYQQPIVDSFYLRHHLAGQGIVGKRRAPDLSKERISLSSMAHYGRFAHSMESYLFGRLYAELHHLEIETPEWQGHYFFDLDDPPIGLHEDRRQVIHVPVRDPGAIEEAASWPKPWDSGEGNMLEGNNYLLKSMARSDFKSFTERTLKIRPYWTQRFDQMIDFVKQKGDVIIALHLRWGDMRSSRHEENYGNIDIGIYVDWLDNLWATLDRPVLYIASDEPEAARTAFASYNPLLLQDLPHGMPMAFHLLDFYMLMKSDLLAISRGSFGLWAATLNQKPRGIFRQAKDYSALVPYDPWDYWYEDEEKGA